ncbi:DUF2335 domain-containing protein [Helcococcus bovis]|uniref:DUF2335 domain-containing protein n=1 Tax=Helcococcus bovis TaxID=3153252 RepID=UPI0038B6CAD6
MAQNNSAKITNKQVESAIEKNPKLLEDLMQKNPDIVRTVISEEISLYSGPIPSPEVLKQYSEIDYDFPNRILAMAENQSSHRIRIEEKVIKNDITNEKIGMILGFILCAISIIGGIYLAANNKNIIGFSAIFVPIASIVGVFITNKKQEKNVIEKNNKELDKI